MPYILVPQNSTTTINCAFDGVTEPYFVVDIGNTTLTDLEFDDRRQQREILSNHSIYEISGPPLAMIEINSTNLNNGTKVKCSYVGKSMPDQATLLVYGLLIYTH